MKTIQNKIQIEVKLRHIKNGHKKSCGTCPVALALQEKLSHIGYIPNDVYGVIVSYHMGEILLHKSESSYRNGEKGKSYFWRNPKTVKNFILKFDRGEKVRPFNFHIMTDEVIKF